MTPDEKEKREKSNVFDEPENMQSNAGGICDFFTNFSLRKLLQEKKYRRLVLLVIAILVHNIPEGLAIGVSFGAVGESESATFEKARNFAIGVAFYCFPEGLAVSLPLRGMGYPGKRFSVACSVASLNLRVPFWNLRVPSCVFVRPNFALCSGICSWDYALGSSGLHFARNSGDVQERV